MYIICGKAPNHKEKHGTDDGIYQWEAEDG